MLLKKVKMKTMTKKSMITRTMVTKNFITIPMKGMILRDTMEAMERRTGTDISNSLAKVRIRYPLIVENQVGTYGQMKRGGKVEQINLDPDRFSHYYDKGAMVISSLGHQEEFHEISVERLGNSGDPDFEVLHRAPRPSARSQPTAAQAARDATVDAASARPRTYSHTRPQTRRRVASSSAPPAQRKAAKPKASAYLKKDKTVKGVRVVGELHKDDDKSMAWMKMGADAHETVGVAELGQDGGDEPGPGHGRGHGDAGFG